MEGKIISLLVSWTWPKRCLRMFLKGHFLKFNILFIQKFSNINKKFHRITTKDYIFIYFHYFISKPYLNP